MVDFCNPGVLGTRSHFNRHFGTPILNGREPAASQEEIELGQAQSEELSTLVNEFILRRTNTLLSEHLPPKIIEIVCCRLSPLQEALYSRFLASKAAKRLLDGKATGVLAAITSLKKLCNHPKLIYDQVHAVTGKGEGGFEDCGDLFPPGMFGRGTRNGFSGDWVQLSGKMSVLVKMLAILRQETNDRIVVVSNYTQTLDLISFHCHEQSYPVIRLDGTVSIKKRQEMVTKFNNPNLDQFIFLLSSKAGGCGLNLIGANRLVLFDPDWNPATDKQAAARVWRDGQKKFVFVYRFLATGTIEEKVFQRQLSKEGLQGLVNKNGKAATSALSAEELRDLFSFQKLTFSDTYDSICRSDVKAPPDCTETPIYKEQEGEPTEDDLSNWSHNQDLRTLPDDIMKKAGVETVSFIFACKVKGKDLELDSVKENQPPIKKKGTIGPKRLTFRTRSHVLEKEANDAPKHKQISASPPLEAEFSSAKVLKRKEDFPTAQILKRIHSSQEA